MLRPWRPAEDGCAVTGCCLMTSTRGLAVFVFMYRGVMTMLRLTGAVTAELPATPTFFATSSRTRFQCQRCFGCEPAGRSSGCCAAPLPGLCTQAQSCCAPLIGIGFHRFSSSSYRYRYADNAREPRTGRSMYTGIDSVSIATTTQSNQSNHILVKATTHLSSAGFHRASSSDRQLCLRPPLLP